MSAWSSSTHRSRGRSSGGLSCCTGGGGSDAEAGASPWGEGLQSAGGAGAGAGSAGVVSEGAASGSGEMSPEAGCEDSGLSVEVLDSAVIPNYVICFLCLLT